MGRKKLAFSENSTQRSMQARRLGHLHSLADKSPSASGQRHTATLYLPIKAGCHQFVSLTFVKTKPIRSTDSPQPSRFLSIVLLLHTTMSAASRSFTPRAFTTMRSDLPVLCASWLLLPPRQVVNSSSRRQRQNPLHRHPCYVHPAPRERVQPPTHRMSTNEDYVSVCQNSANLHEVGHIRDDSNERIANLRHARTSFELGLAQVHEGHTLASCAFNKAQRGGNCGTQHDGGDMLRASKQLQQRCDAKAAHSEGTRWRKALPGLPHTPRRQGESPEQSHRQIACEGPIGVSSGPVRACDGKCHGQHQTVDQGERDPFYLQTCESALQETRAGNPFRCACIDMQASRFHTFHRGQSSVSCLGFAVTVACTGAVQQSGAAMCFHMLISRALRTIKL
eukprot:6181975-Pleurochrysis_carterae.AAC.1